MKLNLGAGSTVIEGFEARDGGRGDVLFPLPDADGSVDEIRASHVLEHFALADIPRVVLDWVRALKPGGVLKIAVPDFAWIAEQYAAGEDVNVQGYVMGGQTDARDFHRTLFDREMLTRLLEDCGLVAVRDWKSEIQDCAALPVSLNLCATKRGGATPKISAVISIPRLGFNDFWGVALGLLQPRGIELRRSMGVYWDRKLTQAFEATLEQDNPDWILALDYDTVFSGQQIDALIDLAARHPEADAIAPIQASRHHAMPMLTVQSDEPGFNRTRLKREELNAELLATRTAHFGCTLIRAEKLRALPRPWLLSTPDEDGRWSDSAVDADIWFWKQWQKAGFSLYTAARVPVGHLDLCIRWPNIDLEAIYQLPRDFHATGVPADIWR